jgi:phage baseplate assembly protein W
VTLVESRDPWELIWPPERGRPAVPVGVGMDAMTGRMLVGWPHVVQSVAKLFQTRFHERILRPWVGSFVPHMIGENLTEATITRFYWAVCTAIDLWEPRYSVTSVRLHSDEETVNQPGDQVTSFTTSADMIRRGEIAVQTLGVYRPRGHLGDFTPESRRIIGIVGNNGRWVAR